MAAPGMSKRERKRDQRAVERAVLKRELAAIRKDIREAKRRQRAAIKDARVICKRAKVKTRERIKRKRAQERARLNREVAQMRQATRNRCAARRAVIKASGASIVEKKRRQAAEAKQLAREMRAIDERSKLDRERFKASAKERREESDSEVRGNIDAALVPVFDSVRRSIRGGPRITRTEAFLQWAEENPGEVIAIQEANAEKELMRMLREEEKLARRVRKTKPRQRAKLADVPF